MQFPPISFPLAYFTLRLDKFSPLVALGIFALFGGFIVLLGLRSMAGLGPVKKWVAISIRLLVLLLVILILGDIKLVRKNTDVEVIAVRDISKSTELVTEHPGMFLQSDIDNYLKTATSGEANPSHKTGDKVGQISFNENAYIDAVPSSSLALESRAIRSAGTGTNAANAIQLALASLDNDSMHRLVLFWDGNDTAGDLDSALAAASSQHVPIDVMPLHYNVEHEVMVDKFIAPTFREEGQPFTIEVHFTNTNSADVQGNLSVTNNGKLMPLKDGQTTEHVQMKPGHNVFRIPVPGQQPGALQFHATIDHLSFVNPPADGTSVSPATDLDNKQADAFTFVKFKNRVLFVDNTDPTHQTDPGQFLEQALADNKIETVTIPPEQFPNNPVELLGYSAVVLANVPRGMGGLSDIQETLLASYIHDQGGGLVMIGGPQTFGAGGWEGSRLEKELPVTMEVPAQRQIPKGALVLIMDPAEAPGGNYLGEQCAIKAMETLSSRDEVGVISYAYSGANRGCRWDAPLENKGDGSKVLSAIKNWELGDMPSFEDSISLALDGDGTSQGLIASNAKAKHIVLITDDDPQMPSDATKQKLIDNKITVSTITVYPHQPGNVAPGVKELAADTHGRFYGPFEGSLAALPQIFIKEATVVKRSIIEEDPKGIPVTLNISASELVKGIEPGPMPKLYGMDITGQRNNPQVQVPIFAGPKHDPVLAHWQAGLGKAAVFTGDSFNRWDADWVGTPMYSKFWSQVVEGVSRSPISADFDSEATVDGDKGHIIIHAAKEGSAFNNFLTFNGTIAGGADLAAHQIRPLQTGPGTYEADFDASARGSYIGFLQYAGTDGQKGSILVGTTVNSSPEVRDLQSNDALLKQIAERTGGRFLTPFDPASADFFTRDGLTTTDSPQSIWDRLIPALLALIIIDVAVRRIAWDPAALRKMALGVQNYIRQFTMTYRKVESPATLDGLRRVREEVAEQKFKPVEKKNIVTSAAAATASRPDPRAKFEAGAGVEGDISTVVGGATDRPVSSTAAKQTTPKGAIGLDEYSGGLLQAKRRAQQKIKEKEEGG